MKTLSNIDFESIHNFIISSENNKLIKNYLKLLRLFILEYGFDQNIFTIAILEDLFNLSDSSQPFLIERNAIICILFLICSSTQEMISLFVNQFNIIKRMILYYDKGDLYITQLLPHAIIPIQQYFIQNNKIKTNQLKEDEIFEEMVEDILFEYELLLS